jgi:hypothetical protein
MPTTDSKLLLDEYPLIILPKLAVAIGLNEAIVLQQIHYWLVHFERAAETEDRIETDHLRDGRWWVYNTVAEWRRQFPFWSYNTVKRALESLRKNYEPKSEQDTKAARGPLLIATSRYNRAQFDKTLWYTIDYDEIERLSERLGGESSEWPKMGHRVAQNGPSSGSKRANRAGQNGRLESSNMAQPIPETTTETTTKTNTETTAAAATIIVTRERRLTTRATDTPSAAAAALLESFGIGAPNSTRLLKTNPDPVSIRAWMLYALTQQGLTRPDRFVAKQLLDGESPPARFLDWARLTRDEWQALWRADRYGEYYLKGVGRELARRFGEWAQDFADVFPDGPFDDSLVTVSSLRAGLDELEVSPPGLDIVIYHDAIEIIPETGEDLQWVHDHEDAIRAAWAGQGVLHEVKIADPDEGGDGTLLRFPGASDVDERTQRIWYAALGELQLQMTQATFDTWLRDSMVVAREDGVFVIGVKNGYCKDWLENRLYTTIQRTLTRLAGEPCEVRFVVPVADEADS